MSPSRHLRGDAGPERPSPQRDALGRHARTREVRDRCLAVLVEHLLRRRRAIGGAVPAVLDEEDSDATLYELGGEADVVEHRLAVAMEDDHGASVRRGREVERGCPRAALLREVDELGRRALDERGAIEPRRGEEHARVGHARDEAEREVAGEDDARDRQDAPSCSTLRHRHAISLHDRGRGSSARNRCGFLNDGRAARWRACRRHRSRPSAPSGDDRRPA